MCCVVGCFGVLNAGSCVSCCCMLSWLCVGVCCVCLGACVVNVVLCVWVFDRVVRAVGVWC